MKICAVICEFNPFHNGHKYLLQQARNQTGCDALLCVMSGNFVQRGEPAVIDKAFRTRHALYGGADIVAELPVMYATANAECFAAGALEIIKRINNVTHLAFGCETPDVNIIKAIAKTRLEESADFKCKLKKLLNDGESYPSAHSKATAIECEKLGIDVSMSDKVLKMPNNLLAIEYCKQIFKQAPHIEITPIKRVGAQHNDSILHENYSSAESIRKKIVIGEHSEVKNSVPLFCLQDIKQNIYQNSTPDVSLFKQLILYKLRTGNLENLFDSGEGLELKLKKNSLICKSLDETIEITKSKRYTRARINRLCLQALFEINKNSLFSDSFVPIRLLGIKKELKKYISNICNSFIITNKDLNESARANPEYLRIEENAAAVYSQLTQSKNTMYSHKLIEI